MARKSELLENIIKLSDLMEKVDEEEIEKLEPDVAFIERINDNAMMIVDERVSGYVLHSVESILLLVIFAIIANSNTFTEMYIFGCTHFEWLSKYIYFENGMPSLSTIKRVISFINPKELENILMESVRTFNNNNAPIYQLGMFKINDIKTTDGKAANASSRNSSKDGKIAKMNAMSIYSVKQQICEATEFIEEKTNEIPTCPKLLQRVNVKDCIIVFDALNTQKETIDYIFSHGGYYVAPIKENHKTLYDDICNYFKDEEFIRQIKNEHYIKNIEKRNGDADIREYGFINNTEWIYNKSKWTGLKSIGFVKRTYKNKKGETVNDTRYYISNLSAECIDIISKAIRSEWNIENNLHWYLDTVFKEDESTAFVRNTQKNLNIIRKFALALLKNYKEKTKLSMNSIRFMISGSFEKTISDILTI